MGFLKSLILLFLLITSLASTAQSKYDVAVYYFPNYHKDSINERWHGKGWTEWDLVKAAQPRFAGHEQPKQPTWGYFDESDPVWAAKEIDLAASHGIDVFIYDWYWYGATGPFLQEGLERGFLKAPNKNKLKFALMWANHNWTNIHPTAYTNNPEKLTDGEVTWALWDSITTYIVENYFKQPNYWTIDGKPYFSIFDAGRFMHSFQTADSAALAIKLFDNKVKAAGFAGLYLNLIDQSIGDNYLTDLMKQPVKRAAILNDWNVSSVTSYNFLAAYDLRDKGWPTASYQQATESNTQYWKKIETQINSLPFFPCVSMGWDVTPRLIATDKYDTFKGYPWLPVLTGKNNPQVFQQALQAAKNYLDAHSSQPKIITINAWNEWTEGSYLLPEKRTDTKYLDAVKAVFGK